MNANEAQHARDLERRLAESDATIQALLSGQIDAVVDPSSSTPVLLSRAQAALRESEDALPQHRRDRERRHRDHRQRLQSHVCHQTSLRDAWLRRR